jgi:hypothetical protein
MKDPANIDRKNILCLIFNFSPCGGSSRNTCIGDNEIERTSAIASLDPRLKAARVPYITDFKTDSGALNLRLSCDAFKAVSVTSVQEKPNAGASVSQRNRGAQAARGTGY